METKLEKCRRALLKKKKKHVCFPAMWQIQEKKKDNRKETWMQPDILNQSKLLVINQSKMWTKLFMFTSKDEILYFYLCFCVQYIILKPFFSSLCFSVLYNILQWPDIHTDVIRFKTYRILQIRKRISWSPERLVR